MSKSIAANPSGEDSKAPLINQRTVIITLFVVAAVSCLFLYHTANPFEFLPRSSAYDVIAPSMKAQVSFFFFLGHLFIYDSLSLIYFYALFVLFN